MPYVNQVIINGNTVIDLTSDTATVADVASGKTFHKKNGEIGIGEYIPPSYISQEKEVEPTKSKQIVTPDSGYNGLSTVTVNAIPSNYIDTTDADATKNDINSGKTAYVNGVKITGSQVVQKYYTGSDIPSSSLGNNGDLYLQL